MSPLEVAGLRKSYGSNEVVAGLSFAVAPGTCFGLLGPNGAGKTTTLRCCLGLTAPDAGDIRLAGLPVPDRADEARRRVGVVAQTDALDPDFTVAENLLVYGRYFGLPEATIRARIPDLLDFAGLAGKAGARVPTLSGGMKRRLTLARALVNDPDIVFLDEPTTGLDPQARHLIWERLKALLARGKTIVLTTHFMDEAERLCSKLMVIDRGRAVAAGAPRALIRQEIEPTVVEVFAEFSESADSADSGQPAIAEWARAHAHLAARVELIGETAFFYCRDAAPLLAVLAGEPGLAYVHRAANLEDVFLKLTGRELRD